MIESNLELLPGSPGCFICDNNRSNPRALRLKLLWDDPSRTVIVDLKPDETWCGYAHVVHGGLVASVLDEAMAWAVKRQKGDWAFTADFQVRYKKPVEPEQAYQVRAKIDDPQGRLIKASAELFDSKGQVMAQAKAVFLPASGRARPRTETESPA